MQEYAANYWLRLGAGADILNIGLPLYGRSFTLQDPTVSGVGAPTRAAGRAGRFTQEDGYLAFYEVKNTSKRLSLCCRLRASSAGTMFSLGGQTRRMGGWTRSGKLTLTLTSCYYYYYYY